MDQQKDAKSLAKKARPIADERDYQATKQLLAEHARTFTPFLEAGRFQSLIRALGEYEARTSIPNTAAAEHAAASAPVATQRLQRRWSDTRFWVIGHAA